MALPKTRALRFVFLLGLLSFIPSAALSFINPLNPGLPQGWTPSTVFGYPPTGTIGNELLPPLDTGRLNVINSWSSVMCVECHSANPSVTSANPTTPYGEPVTDYHGSHFVKNYYDGRLYATNMLVAAAWELVTPWEPGGQLNKGLSRYGSVGTNDSIIMPTDSATTPGEMVCESCHNIIVNNAKYLLLGDFRPAVGDCVMCEDCHNEAASGPPEHHPLTGHTVGADSDQSLAHTLTITHFTHLVSPAPNDADRSLNTDNTGYYAGYMVCISCHKPHDATTATGARIIRRGRSHSTNPLVINKSVNVVYTNGVPDAGVVPGQIIVRKPAAALVATGLHRQSDMDAGKRLLTNQDPLCESCH